MHTVETAERWARRLEDAAAARIAQPLAVARRFVARELGLSPGTLETLRKRRAKSVSHQTFGRLREGVERLLEAEIATLERELEEIRKSDPGDRTAAICAAETALEQARKALGR